MEAETKRSVLTRLRRIEGQVGGLHRMVEEDADCVDILLQVAAAQGALVRAGELILGSHIRTCVHDAFAHGSDAERSKKIEELMDVFARYGGVGGR